MTGLLQAGNVRKVSKIFGMVETVPDQKLVRCIEPDEPRGMRKFDGDMLMQQSTDLQRFWSPITEQLNQTIERASGINNVLYEQNVLTLQFSFRIIEQTYDTTRFHRVAVRRRDKEIDL